MSLENIMNNLVRLAQNPGLQMAMHTIGYRSNRVDNNKRLLRILAETNRGMPSGTIAEILGIRPASVSVLVSKAEKNGYVERIKDANDARVVLVHITAAGRENLENQVDLVTDFREAVFAPLDEAERDAFETSLEKINAHIETEEFTTELVDMVGIPDFAKRIFQMKQAEKQRQNLERFGHGHADHFDKHMEHAARHVTRKMSKHLERFNQQMDKHGLDPHDFDIVDDQPDDNK